jgi:iron-sulfur cluster repair protein YtfE (RIC family)
VVPPTKEDTMTAARTTTPDLLGITLAHRMMRRDLHRLTDVAERIAAGEGCTDRRAAALARWTTTVCDEVHHHHTVEDEALMPLLATRAGAELDLADLGADHRALDPLLDAIRAATARLTAAPAGPARATAAAALGEALARVRDELDEHIADEEVSMFPAIERYLTVEEWAAVEKRARDGGLPMGFVLPRIIDATRPDELATLKREAGPVLMVLAALVGPGYRRRERLVFG